MTIPISATAFQPTAFQHDGFQIGESVGSGDRWPLLPALWQQAQMERERRRKEREEREEALATVEVDVVTAQAEPVVIDLATTLQAVAPTPVVKARDDLADFLALMIKLAESEDEFA